MNVKGMSRSELESIASSLDVRLYNFRGEQDGSASFVLRPNDPDRWRRRGHTGRRIWAVCYHGHYAFMRMVFERSPDAEIRTSMARYVGRADFERKALGVGDRNIGNRWNPLSLNNACDCGPTERLAAMKPFPSYIAA